MRLIRPICAAAHHPPAALMLALLAALTLLFFHRLAFSGLILGRGDMVAYFYPYWTVRSAALLGEHSPLWTPNVFMGVPLLANSQVGMLYPLNWLVTPLPVPRAVSVSILLHIFGALAGTFLLARQALALGAGPALLAAVIFALGGYLGAKAESINQLQALAWMPWLFLAFSAALRRPRHLLLLGSGLALQALAGHPQTVFITLVGLAVYGLASVSGGSRRTRLRSAMTTLILLAAAGLIAALLAAPQLIPTLELAGTSNRSGGLNPQQAMAFSLNPALIGRGLLPSYDSLVFGEYVAYPGIIGLGLALLGLARRAGPAAPARRAWIVVLVVGLGLALGVYNPLYWTLAGLPGFSFFRVPARWLALFALAAALLAGYGLQTLRDSPGRPRWPLLIGIAAVIGGLMAASFLTNRAAEDVLGSALPTAPTLAGWAAALLTLLLALALRPRLPGRWIAPLLCAAAVLELFAAARVLAYNELVPPDTASARRFTISQLQVYARQSLPPGRMLSISQLLFDPGDKPALEARYQQAGLSERAIRFALVATKQREVVAPNLSLTWDLASIDGFDGGLLPTGYYTQFSALLLPPDDPGTRDGRLGEILAREDCRGACIPDQRWLNLTNTRFLITDKVYDLWHTNIAYDTQFERAVAAGQRAPVRAVPPFETTAVHLLYTAAGCPDESGCPPLIRLELPDRVETLAGTPSGEVGGWRLAVYPLTEPGKPVGIAVEAAADTRLLAMTLVDSRIGVFRQLTLGPWLRVLSSDIKIYDNLDGLSRAWVVHSAEVVADSWAGGEQALALMRAPGFDPARTAVILGPAETLPPQEFTSGPTAIISAYSAERVEIHVNTAQRGYLILSDAYYPGWEATVGGQPVPVYRADIMFRAVPVPAGESAVVFSYRPAWWPGVLILGAAAWLVALAAVMVLHRRSAR